MLAEYQVENGTLTLSLRGRLDAEAARSLRPVVERLAEDPVPRLVVDLGGVDFMDGSGLGALAYLLKRAGHRRVSLAGASGQPRALLRHLGLGAMLDSAVPAVPGKAAPGLWDRLGLGWLRRRRQVAGDAVGNGLAWAGARG